MEKIYIALLSIMAVLTGCAGRTDNGKIVIDLDKAAPKIKDYAALVEIVVLRKQIAFMSLKMI